MYAGLFFWPEDILSKRNPSNFPLIFIRYHIRIE